MKRVKFEPNAESDGAGESKRARDSSSSSCSHVHSSSAVIGRPTKVASEDDPGEEFSEVHGGPTVDFDEGGEEFVAFNMDAEKEEDGHFDEGTGAFVWKKREEARARRAGMKEDLDEEEEDEDREDEEKGGGKVGVKKRPFVKGGRRAAAADSEGEEEESEEERVSGVRGGDAWLDDLNSLSGAERQRLQTEARQAQERRRLAAAGGGGGSVGASGSAGGSSGAAEPGDSPALLRALSLHTLVTLLRGEETVAAALRRLGGGAGGGKGRNSWKKKAAQGGGGAAAAAQPEGTRDMPSFNALTDASDALLRTGVASVYDFTKRKAVLELSESLADAGLSRAKFDGVLAARGLAGVAGASGAAAPAGAPADPASAAQDPGSTGSTGASAAPPLFPSNASVRWEFKWVRDASEAVHGPFDSVAMNAWQAHFQQEPVMVRPIGGTWALLGAAGMAAPAGSA